MVRDLSLNHIKGHVDLMLQRIVRRIRSIAVSTSIEYKANMSEALLCLPSTHTSSSIVGYLQARCERGCYVLVKYSRVRVGVGCPSMRIVCQAECTAECFVKANMMISFDLYV